MSPFPQSVANTSAFSTVFLVPSPVAFVLRVSKNLKRRRTKATGDGTRNTVEKALVFATD